MTKELGEQPVRKVRLDWPDCYRGFAIILIVAGHAAKMLLPSGFPLADFARVLGDLQLAGFATFFAISGMNSRRSLEAPATAFWGGRFLSLLYLLLVWALLTAVVDAATHGRWLGLAGAARALGTALTYPLTHLWFVWSLLVYSALARLLMRRWPWASLAGALLITVAALCLDRAFWQRHPLPHFGSELFVIRRAFGYMFFFFLGFRYREQLLAVSRGPMWRTWIVTTIAGSALLWAADRMPTNLIGAPMRLAALFIGLVATIYVGRLLASLPVGRRLFLWLGRFTLPVYLIHIPVLIVGISMLAPGQNPMLRGHPAATLVVLTLLGVAGGLAGAFLIRPLRLTWLFRPPQLPAAFRRLPGSGRTPARAA